MWWASVPGATHAWHLLGYHIGNPIVAAAVPCTLSASEAHYSALGQPQTHYLRSAEELGLLLLLLPPLLLQGVALIICNRNK